VASKFGVVGLTQAMAFELAPHGITVNSVCPGYVDTPMQERELGWEAACAHHGRHRQAAVDRRTPLGRLEAPQDVARAVAFLAGPDARFITGEALAVTAAPSWTSRRHPARPPSPATISCRNRQRLPVREPR